MKYTKKMPKTCEIGTEIVEYYFVQRIFRFCSHKISFVHADLSRHQYPHELYP